MDESTVKIMNYQNIKARELKSQEINQGDIIPVDELHQALKIRSKIASIFFTLAMFPCALILLTVILEAAESWRWELLVGLIITIPIILLFIYSQKTRKLILAGTSRKSQYGIVHNIYTVKKGNSSNRITRYYAEVIFPDTNTYIKSVYCENSFVGQLSKGKPILVISFDNSTVYGLPPSKM